MENLMVELKVLNPTKTTIVLLHLVQVVLDLVLVQEI